MPIVINQLTRDEEAALWGCIKLTDRQTLSRIADRWGLKVGYTLQSDLFDYLTKAYYDNRIDEVLIFANACKSPIAHWYCALDDWESAD